MFSFLISNESETERFGRLLAETLPAGTVVALNGTLGAGKTRLVRAVAEALGVAEGEVQSPTFVLIREYDSSPPIYHFDAYRLRDEDEFAELGPDEYFDADGLSFVEWANRVETALPSDRLEIALEVLSETERRVTLQAHGAFPQTVFQKLCEELSES